MKILRNSVASGAVIAVACVFSAGQAGPRAISLSSKPPQIKQHLGQQQQQQLFVTFIVKLKRDTGASRIQAASAAGSVAHIAARAIRGTGGVSVRVTRTLSSGAHVVRASRALRLAEATSFVDAMRRDPSVAYAQIDYMKYAVSLPNDTHFATLQWDLTDPSVGINAPGAWDTSEGAGVVVGVLDTGVVDHGDLRSNLVPGYDFVSWHGQTIEGATYPDIAVDGDGRDPDARDPGDATDGSEWFCDGQRRPSSWHGTHVAGTVAAVTNNSYGVAGVAPKAKVQPIRVLGRCGGLTSDIVDGLTWASGGAVDGLPPNPTPADVVNLSLGSGYSCAEDPAMQEAINGAVGRGTTVVVAAGNANINASRYSPASCTGVVTVGATGSDGARSYYSNYGYAVAVAAPGGNADSADAPDEAWIWSLGNRGQAGPVASPEGDAIMGQIGTSMAAPHVAGIAALMQNASVAGGHGAMPPALVKGVLRATAKPFLVPPGATPVGSGIADAAAATQVAAAGAKESDLAVSLTNRVTDVIQGLSSGDSAIYKISVPAGVTSLTIRSFGGVGDVALYVGLGTVPDSGTARWRSTRTGNTEAVSISRPTAGVYFARISAGPVSTNVSVLAAH